MPNSGNLGSVELFPIVLRVDGVSPGIYHFDSVRCELACVRRGDFGRWTRHSVYFQVEHSTAAVALCLTSAVGRLKSKYGPRGYRLGLFDVGHVSENLYVIATALGLAICATAGFVDEELDAALGVDGLDVATMLVLLVGPPGVTGRLDESTRS